MAHHYIFLCTLLSYSLSLHGISAVDYLVTNITTTPGGIRFDKEIGIPFTKQLMAISNDYIWTSIFQQTNPSDQKPIDVVNLYITEVEKGDAGVTWGNNNINISESFIGEYIGDLKWAYKEVLYHEMAHVFQWDGEGHAPSGLVEGIADYVTFKANYNGPRFADVFAKPGDGEKWDQGYQVTARFLEYCDGIVPGFVAKINGMMRFAYDVKYFDELTEKSVDQLWDEYKAKYGH